MLSAISKKPKDSPKYDELVLSKLESQTHYTTREDCVVDEWLVERIPEECQVNDNRMAYHCFLRSLLTLLHALIGLEAGFLFVYSLIGWDYDAEFLPRMVDHFGDPVKFHNGLPALFGGLVYGMAAMCVVSLLMGLILNCLWQNRCIAILNLLVSTLFVGFTVLGGTAFTVYYMVWCDSLEQTHHVGVKGCVEAARRYDRYNSTAHMTFYRQRMEVQQTCIWAMLPLTFIAVITYSVAIWLFSTSDSSGGGVNNRGQFRYVLLHDETTPLVIQNEDQNRYDLPRQRSQSLQGVASSNPFDA